MSIPLAVTTPGEFQSLPAVAQMAAALERARIDACFVIEHPAPPSQWLHSVGYDALDPFTALAFVASASTKLLLHINLIVLPYRNPFMTAKAAATLQVFSKGRLILGVGAGYLKPEFDALGVDFRQRGALTDEALEVLQLAWAGKPVVKQGLHFNAADIEPRPIPDPLPRIWVGGASDKAIARAARWGDGWSPFFTPPAPPGHKQEPGISTIEQLRERIERIQEMRAQLGRSGPFDIMIGPRVGIRNRTRDEADQMLEELSTLARVGVNWAMVGMASPSRAAYIENVEWFGEEVVARLT